MAPKEMRATYSKARRNYRKRFGDNAYWHYPAGSEMRLAALAANKALWEAWRRCLDDVTGRCMAGGEL
ncbi:hypothetical protein GCM10017322_23090 [Paracoccus aerius]|nr:hypothetical protein GCM10017322_23090 [Paracoccus aerius]